MLTDAQKVDVRRYAGYPYAGADPSFIDPVIYRTRISTTTLTFWLNNITATEQTVLVTFLTQLAVLETGILGAADNMDTKSAGPWSANQRERQDRESLFNSWRRKMCAFIGIPPGPGLGDGSISLLRA